MKNNRLVMKARNNEVSKSLYRRKRTKCFRREGRRHRRRVREKQRLRREKIKSDNDCKSQLKEPLPIIEEHNKPSEPIMPWISQATINSKGTMKLHNEINDFVSYITPRNHDMIQREKTIAIFTKFINSHWPSWTIKLYGSYIQGTQINQSDIDFAVFKSEGDVYMTDDDQLVSINRRMIKDGFFYEIQLIRNARVPIIKAVCEETRINIDVCVNKINGHEAAKVIAKKLDKEPELRKIIIVLKYLLKANELNNASTGGMSSYLLFTMVFFFYQQMKRRNEQYAYIEDEENEENATTTASVPADNAAMISSPLTAASTSATAPVTLNRKNSMMTNEGIPNLGLFLFAFLKFYTVYFNHLEAGITLRNGGHHLYKIQPRPFQSNNNLTVVNFQDNEHDIGKSCYKYQDIIHYFKYIRDKLKEAKEKNHSSFFHSIGIDVVFRSPPYTH